ncbi:MAG: four helix bundle protein [Chloroflexi bacterium]|nr:four helix bundle protein [Chloroflexota bacterium]
MITSYRSLRVWQQGMDLVEDIYRLTRGFPSGSTLARQMQHAAVQVPSNVARGQARGFTGEYLGHVAAAEGALAELMTYLELALRVGYIKDERAAALRSKGDGLGKQLWALRTSLQHKLD